MFCRAACGVPDTSQHDRGGRQPAVPVRGVLRQPRGLARLLAHRERGAEARPGGWRLHRAEYYGEHFHSTLKQGLHERRSREFSVLDVIPMFTLFTCNYFSLQQAISL